MYLLHPLCSRRTLFAASMFLSLFGFQSTNLALADGPARPKAVQRKPQTAPIAPIDEPKKSPAVYETLVNAVAYVEADVPGSNGWSGTAWLYDADRKLMVTNLHVVATEEHKEVKSLGGWFPVMRDGEAIHDIDYYVKNVPKFTAKIIYTDKLRDLALIQLDSLPKNAVPLKLAEKSAQVGSMLYSLGGLPRGSQGLFIYTQGNSRAVYKRSIAIGGPIQVLETQMPLNQGNSGGPIVNDAGEVVAVFEGLVIEHGVQLVNMSIDLSELRTFLEEALPHVDGQTVKQLLARGDLHYYAGRYNAALADYNAVLKLEPKNAEAMSNRGWVMYQKEDFDTALAEFDAALELDPNLAYAAWGRGMVHNSQGKHQEAISDFTKALRFATEADDLASIYNERGNAHYQGENYEAAVSDYDRAIEKKADLAWAHANRGDALAQLKRYDEAFAALDKAIALDKKEAQFWNIAGNAWYDRERYDFAANMYSNAINIDPKTPLYYRNRGGAKRQAANYAEAANDLAKALELAPKDDDCWNELGLAWFDAEQYSNAAVAFSRALDLDSGNAIYFANRGHSNLKLGQYQQAVSDLTKAIADAPDAFYYKLRGEAQQALGNSKSAKADFSKAVELDPEYTYQDRKFPRAVNNTSEELKIYLQYYTRGSDGKWRWYPASGDPLVYTFAPGENYAFLDKDWTVKASRVRIWAETPSRHWSNWKKTDLVLVPEGGYLNTSEDPDSFTLPFNDN